MFALQKYLKKGILEDAKLSQGNAKKKAIQTKN